MLIFWRQKKSPAAFAWEFSMWMWEFLRPFPASPIFYLVLFYMSWLRKKLHKTSKKKKKRTLYSFSTQQDGLDLLNLSFEVSLKSGQKVLHEKSTLYKSNCRIAELLDFHWKNGTRFLFICLPSVPCRFIPWFEILGQILMRYGINNPVFFC